MTAPKHSKTDGDAVAKTEYSEYDRLTLSRYHDVLTQGRYFTLYNAASPVARIISGDSHADVLPLSWLCADLRKYCRQTGRTVPLPMPSADYIAYNLNMVNGTIFKPKGPAMYSPRYSRHSYVNIYKHFEQLHKPLPLPPVFHRLFECMFPDPVERHTFLQYVSHMFQFPEVRPSWHPMLLSATGTGKGFLFAAILTPLLCGQTRLLKKYSELLGRFANAMYATILVLLDDCKSKREDTQTSLKSLMSEERVLLEEKNLAAGMVTTYTRFFLASNEEVPLDLDDTERRWWIPKRMGYSDGLTGDEGRKERVENVIRPLSEWLEKDGALDAIHAYFMAYDLTGFDPKSPPMTETLREQIAKSVTVEQAFTADYLSAHKTKVLKSEDLSAAFAQAGMSKPGNIAIGKLFQSCDYQQDFITIGGTKSRWRFPASMTKNEAEAILHRPVEF
jgi:hypothetical protein